MDIKKLLIATLVGTIVFFLLGWVIWGIILDPINADHVIEYEGLRPEYPNLSLIAASCLAFSLMLCYIYLKWANIKTFMTGAKAGALISVLVGLNYSLMMKASMNLVDWTVVGTDTIGNLVWGFVGGGVVGLVIGALSKDE